MSREETKFRLARRSDLPSIVRMLADDELGSQRERYEDPLPQAYYVAFEQIEVDPNHELVVAELNGEVIGTLHLMFLPSVSFQGGLRADRIRASRQETSKSGHWKPDAELDN